MEPIRPFPEHEKLPCVQFRPPKRPNYGRFGQEIILRTNLFAMKIEAKKVQHHRVEISGGVSRKFNREIFTRFLTSFPAHFADMHPVYDGNENMYTKKLLPLDKQMMTVTFIIQLEPEVKAREVKISVKWIGEISLVPELGTDYLEFEAIKVIDTILRHLPSLQHSNIGKSFFSRPLPEHRQSLSLGGGLEIWMGYHQSIKLTPMGYMVNIDLSAAAFHGAMPVMEFLSRVLELPEHVLERGITESQRSIFFKAIKNLHVELTHFPTRTRSRKVTHVTQMPASQLTFNKKIPDGGTERCTVARHFLEAYQIKLQYPNLPCLQVGQKEFGTYYPMEVCVLADKQRSMKGLTDAQSLKMISTSAIPAPKRERGIENKMRSLKFENDLCANDFGIKVNNHMTELKGRVLYPPRLIYRDSYASTPMDGAWETFGNKFIDGTPINQWAIVCFEEKKYVDEECLRKFVHLLKKISGQNGMWISDYPIFCKYASGVEQVELVMKFLKHTYKELQLVIVILPGKKDFYSEVKRVGDTLLGVTTQCVKSKNVVRILPKAVHNIFLKINAKLGGLNCILNPSFRPPIFNESVIFLGCNVAHLTVSDNAVQSFVSIVGSMDAHPSKYAATVRVQEREDVIKDMAEMVKELLLRFHISTGFKPSRIVVYRDGSSESQFNEILQYELRAIRVACKMIEEGYQPGITFIAVLKRHHTRLFAKPSQQIGKSHNIPPGTTVDTMITHPVHFDFFLCSHAGIQGTSRPTRYFVLWDDNKLGADEMQQMTYQLCHTYVRCNRSVSIPAPAYYAFLVCVRAKTHLMEKEGEGSEASEKPDVAQLAKVVQVHPNTRDKMYFV